MTAETILKGQVLSFASSPFEGDPASAAHLDEALVIRSSKIGGKITDLGSFDALKAAHPQAHVVDHGNRVILAGFVDAHVHYPQTAMIASWGKRLIDSN